MTRRSRLVFGGVLAGAALTVSACGGGAGSSEPTAGGSDSTSPGRHLSGTHSTAPTSSEGVVDGVTLTPQGTRLRLGETAKVSWHPDQKKTGVIGIRVTGLQKVPISAFSAWRLDPATQRSTPYYVHVRVKNLGHSNLSHVPVPLYLLDQRNILLQASTFRARFVPCPSRPLPAGFTQHKSTSACLVYFVPDHGTLAAISFRPSQDYDAITWTGKMHQG